VTERANYFRRMRDSLAAMATAYVEQRKAMEYPWLKDDGRQTTDYSITTAVSRHRLWSSRSGFIRVRDWIRGIAGN